MVEGKVSPRGGWWLAIESGRCCYYVGKVEGEGQEGEAGEEEEEVSGRLGGGLGLGEVSEGGGKKRIVALEVERSHNEASWHQELDAKEKLIKGHTLHHTKQASSIENLHGNVASFKEDIGHLKWEITERDDRITFLGKEVGAEKQHRVEAQESARLDRLAAESLKQDLAIDQLAHQASRAEIQDLEVRLAHLIWRSTK